MKTFEATSTGSLDKAYERALEIDQELRKQGHATLYTNFIIALDSVFIVVVYREGGVNASD
jgi:hypothetical protein